MEVFIWIPVMSSECKMHIDRTLLYTSHNDQMTLDSLNSLAIYTYLKLSTSPVKSEL